ncbi:MAG TPA: beta-galactosidase [Rhizomicrobium sp.]|nr:beta-galactosidase [Rhizomicrobium sp.]
MRWIGFGAFVAALLLCAPSAFAAAVLGVDAREQPAAPETGYFHFGTNVAPTGDKVEINNRYLTLNGKPWLPVMGEFHFTRVPQQDWEAELSKMKSAGVGIVSTYIFWNHHEAESGSFVWTGNRDLRRFVSLAGRLGLKVFVRPGPWVHSEARFGGIPDWVVRAMPTRMSDPTYLHYVGRYWDQIGTQLKGLLFKDGGPVIGVQLENEYNLTSPGQGRDHIAALKKLALAAGLDVPIYTVTGWDNTVYPAHEVTPVEGGYADQPWGLTTSPLPPSEVYAFRFDTRVRGNLGAETTSATTGDAETDTAHTPFLGAEFGGGLPTMYRRRPILRADDTAAMLPVELGSGVNLYGYYMFHGGQNSPDHYSLEENTSIGAYNDLPMIDYDFQAPIGAYGQEHVVMGKIRPFHYFLEAFGSDLAPMMVHKPDVMSKGAADLTTPRFSVRSLGDSGFLFVNNHVRQYDMAVQKEVQFSVRLPHGTVTFPAKAIDVPTGAYFIWPINMDLSGATLVYATAQPVTRIEDGKTTVYVFRAENAIPTEFCISSIASVTAATGQVSRDAANDRVLISNVQLGTDATIDVTTRDGRSIRLLVLTSKQSEQLMLPRFGGKAHLLLTDAQSYEDRGNLVLNSTGDPEFRFEIFPSLRIAPQASLPPSNSGKDGVFEVFQAHAKPRTISVEWKKIRDAQPVPPLTLGAPGNTAHEPAPETIGKSAAWTITLRGTPGDAFLRIAARGDVARLFSGTTMLDDRFLDGSVWEIGLDRFKTEIAKPLTLTILPLRKDAPIYLEQGVAGMVTGDQTADVTGISVVPLYRLEIALDEASRRAHARSH